MPKESVRRVGEENVMVKWPASVAETPDYPELNLSRFDLACDVIAYKPKLETEAAG